MHRYDSRGELAPRDVVARAIDREMRRHDVDFVCIDTSGFDEGFACSRFPALSDRCKRAGLDFPRDPIPVIPAAHYMCGGLRTEQTGATRVTGLFACGEVAHTGLHGANRLASNSLLEAVVYAVRVAEALNEELRLSRAPMRETPTREKTYSTHDDAFVRTVASQKDAVRRLMWQDAGIVRSDGGLQRADTIIRGLRDAMESFADRGMNRDVAELINLATVARLITKCAIWRKESRGLHHNLDHPNRGGRAWRRDSVVLPKRFD
jgi:L-aspartate oxidase